MKKLLTIFTAAGLLVAGGSSALALEGANDGNGEFMPFENEQLAPKVDKEIRDQLAVKGAKKTADKNGGVWVEVNGVKKFIPGKKAPAKVPGKKVLPKTSAAK